jgi:chromate transporter
MPKHRVQPSLHKDARACPRAYGIGFDAPVLSSVDPWALALALAAGVAIFRFKIGMIPVLAACSAVGILLYLAGAVR